MKTNGFLFTNTEAQNAGFTLRAGQSHVTNDHCITDEQMTTRYACKKVNELGGNMGVWGNYKSAGYVPTADDILYLPLDGDLVNYGTVGGVCTNEGTSFASINGKMMLTTNGGTGRIIIPRSTNMGFNGFMFNVYLDSNQENQYIFLFGNEDAVYRVRGVMLNTRLRLAGQDYNLGFYGHGAGQIAGAVGAPAFQAGVMYTVGGTYRRLSGDITGIWTFVINGVLYESNNVSWATDWNSTGVNYSYGCYAPNIRNGYEGYLNGKLSNLLLRSNQSEIWTIDEMMEVYNAIRDS